MGVLSDGSYGIKKGIIYSFPVTCSNGKYKIVQNLKIDKFSEKKMAETEKELFEEKETAFEFLKIN
jgi:malate/lactate dehydrogenase